MLITRSDLHRLLWSFNQKENCNCIKKDSQKAMSIHAENIVSHKETKK